MACQRFSRGAVIGSAEKHFKIGKAALPAIWIVVGGGFEEFSKRLHGE